MPAAEEARRTVGKVVDLLSRAVPGIEVRFLAMGPGGIPTKAPPVDPVVTDGEGIFEMPAPPVRGELEVASPRFVTVFAGESSDTARVRRPRIVVAPKGDT